MHSTEGNPVKRKTSSTKLNRRIAPPITDAVNYSLSLRPYDRYVLDNGIPVYSINAGTQDVLQIEMIFYAGNFYEKQTGVAAATNYLLKNGTASRTAFAINEAYEYYGAYCNRVCYNETASLTLHTLSKHLPKLLPVTCEVLSESTFIDQELDIYKQNSIQRLKVNMKKAEFVAGRLIDSYVYGRSHPYGTYTNPQDIEALTPEMCREFYGRHYVNGSCAIFVAGKLPTSLPQLLNDNFGKLKATAFNGVLPSHSFAPSAEKKFRIENDPSAVQGAIRIASPFPDRHHPDFKKVVVLNTLLGGFFGSRLMSNIREDKGYTYGIYSYLQNHMQNSAWVISTEAGKDVCEPAIAEIYKEMKRLCDEPVAAEELQLVRNYMIGGILGELDGPFHLIAKWKNIILNNLDENYFNDSVNIIRNINSGELMELAQKYLQPQRFYELVVY